MTWITYAAISAAAAALTAVLAKVGVEGVPSNLATAIRTVVVLTLAWSIALGFGEQRALHTMSRRSLVFLVLSAIATGVSWLAYYRALQLAPACMFAPIDKMSRPLTLSSRSVPRRGDDVGLILGVVPMTAGRPYHPKVTACFADAEE